MIESLSIDPLESYSKLFARLPGFDLSCNDLLTCLYAFVCVMFQLLKKGGTEKYLFGDSGFLSVSKEPGLRVLLVRCSGFLGFDYRRESIDD